MATSNEKAPMTDEARDKALRESYNAAMTRLKNDHLDEFNKLRAEEALQRGVEWAPKKSKEDRAAEQIEALLAEHPTLRKRLVTTSAQVYGSPIN